MKRNLLTVLILALLIVNIVLTSVMIISVIGTNQKTAKLVGDIAIALNLELTGPAQQEPEAPTPSAIDLVEVPLEDKMTILLQASPQDPASTEAPKATYIQFRATILLYTKAKGYETINEAAVAARANLISNTISGVVSSHTKEQLQADPNLTNLKAEILAALQALFDDTDTIYDVAITGVAYA
ncbi:MAG: flagellar basal body-associated FliL family protein [Clostridium sp.]|jgi:flagellar FliL protein|nr:flagellar basal body-associated FliL family protein [Clostridium sp.]